MKAPYKKKIAITGSTGLLGSYFYKKFKKKYKIIKCKKRLESHNQLKKWINKTNFERIDGTSVKLHLKGQEIYFHKGRYFLEFE